MGEYSLRFKVPTSGEHIGFPLEKYSYNHDISPTLPLFIKGEKEMRFLLEGKKECELIKEERVLM